MGRSLWSVALSVFLLAAPAAMATAPIVRDGKTDWVIVVPDGASATEAYAGQELARYLGDMSGATFEIVPKAPNRRNTFVVATYDNAMRGPVPGNLGKPDGDDGYTIVGAQNAIFICGRTPQATLHGVYAFLDSVGCRFLAPTFDHYKGTSEVVPKRTTLEADEAIFRPSSPALKFRKLYVEEGHSHTIDNLKQMVEWMPKVGYNTLVVPMNYQGHDRVKWDNWRTELMPELQKRGITIEVGGHGYQNFINASMGCGQLFDAHPDWFGQDAKGVRRKEPAWVFCTSNPAAVDYFTNEFLAYITARPEIQIYDFWPPDGAKWCECDKCRALGTPSDRQAILLGRVKEAAAKVHPDLRLEMIAYASYVAPPEHATVDPSVLVDFCPISQQFDRQIDDPASKRNADYAADLQAWRKRFAGDISIYSYYRKYAWDSLPLVLPHYIRHDLKWYATLPTQGVSTYSEPGDWFTYELNHYCLAALAWDPNCDVDAVVRKFAAARYGAAADTAVAAYAALEDVVRTTCSVPNTPRPTADALAKGKERLVTAAAGVRDAASSAADPSAKYNLQRLSLMLDYALGDIEARQLAAAGDKEAARARAKALFRHMSAHFDEGVYLSRNGRLSEARLLTRLGLQGKTPAAE